MGLFGGISNFLKSEAGNVSSLLEKGIKGASSIGRDILKTGGGVLEEVEKLAPLALKAAEVVADPEAAIAGVLKAVTDPVLATAKKSAPQLTKAISKAIAPDPVAIKATADAKSEVVEAEAKKNVADKTSETISKLAEASISNTKLKNIKDQFPGNDAISKAMRAALSQQSIT